MADIVSILGLGAIGLGFLLAYLTYRLLATERENNRPIYVYQFFCFALVLVGAWLQYSSTVGNQDVDRLQSKIESLQAELTPLKEQMPNLQDELQSVKQKLNGAVAAMQGIITTIPQSITDLEAVNAVLTGNSCSGGSAGVPLSGGRGTQMAALSTTVISRLAAAKSSIEGVLP